MTLAYDKCYAIAKKGTSKAERRHAFAEVKEEVKALLLKKKMKNLALG